MFVFATHTQKERKNTIHFKNFVGFCSLKASHFQHLSLTLGVKTGVGVRRQFSFFLYVCVCGFSRSDMRVECAVHMNQFWVCVEKFTLNFQNHTLRKCTATAVLDGQSKLNKRNGN